MAGLPTDDPPLSFEDSLAELQQIVHDLEEGDLGLETSLLRFESGIRLLRSCYRILEQAEQKIEILTNHDAAGNAMTEPFDATATFEGGEKPPKKPGRRRIGPKAESSAPDTAQSREADGREEGGLF